MRAGNERCWTRIPILCGQETPDAVLSGGAETGGGSTCHDGRSCFLPSSIQSSVFSMRPSSIRVGMTPNSGLSSWLSGTSSASSSARSSGHAGGRLIASCSPWWRQENQDWVSGHSYVLVDQPTETISADDPRPRRGRRD